MSIILVDAATLINLTRSAGLSGLVGASPTDDIAAGIDALNLLSQHAALTGDQIAITDVVYNEVAADQIYKSDLAIDSWITARGIETIDTTTGQGISDGTLPSNLPNKGELSIADAVNGLISD